MPPGPRQPGDGLSREQQRRLLVLSVGVGGLLLLLVLGLTGASHLVGTGGGFDGPPEAAFSVQTEERDGELVANVTHAGGQAGAPSEIVIEVDGQRRGNWSALGGEGAGIVAPGHSVVVRDVEPGQEVRVLWTGGDQPVELDRNTVRAPDGTTA